jgi:putative hemolysin
MLSVLNAKDFFQLEDKSKENIMNTIVREPYFVHENMKADRLFARMKQNDADRFAVVVDEYGGMSGILTVTDLVEQLVGDFDDDDSDEPSHKLKQISENEWIIPGITPMSEVADKLDAALPADKYDTFGGYVIAMLGEIPKDGTQVHLDTDALRINVLEIKHHRIENCRVEKILPPVEDEVE